MKIEGTITAMVTPFDKDGAVDGVAELLVPVNVDDPRGGYTVRARDLASGKFDE